jgi:hypothetical protein
VYLSPGVQDPQVFREVCRFENIPSSQLALRLTHNEISAESNVRQSHPELPTGEIYPAIPPTDGFAFEVFAVSALIPIMSTNGKLDTRGQVQGAREDWNVGRIDRKQTGTRDRDTRVKDQG